MVDHSMIETCCLKEVIFFQTILSFALSRKIKLEKYNLIFVLKKLFKY